MSTYDRETQILEVEFADGSIIRYFDIDPKCAFLTTDNSRQNYDFLNYLRNDGMPGHPPITYEVLRGPTVELPESDQNAADISRQQNGTQNNAASWLPAWSYKG